MKVRPEHNYLKMYKSQGLRLVLRYFLDAHLFDIFNSTDTARMKYVGFESIGSHNYMVSWTSSVNEIIECLLEEVDGINEYQVCDIGSGKGKVLLLWMKIRERRYLNFSVTGFELDKSLVEICRANFDKCGLPQPEIYSENFFDLTEELKECSRIYYLYNPFDLENMQRFQSVLRTNDYVIYVNPVHDHLFFQDMQLTHHKTGWHPNLCWSIFRCV